LDAQTWTVDLALYEDGQRVAITDSTFEWWYFDMIMDDGSTCVVNFLNKPPFTTSGLLPILQLNISPPWEGQYFQELATFPASTYSAAPERCSVRMGSNLVEGDLQTYRIQAASETLAVDLTVEGWVPGWRTGPFLSPDEAAQQWLGEQVIIPSGTVSGTLMYDGMPPNTVTGTCYHDHQWGGASLQSSADAKVTSWYWGRARVGDHSIVFAQVLGQEGTGPIVPIGVMFMLARDTRLTFDETLGALTVTPLLDPNDSGNGANLGIEVVWTSNQGAVRLTLPTPREIASFKDGGYLRYLSPATLTSTFAGEDFSGSGSAIWEINLFNS